MSELAAKYQIDGVTLMHETGSSAGSIVITQDYFLFLSKSTVMSVGLFGVAGSAIGSLFATLADKFGSQKDATPPTEQELVSQSGDRHVEIAKIREIKVQRKLLAGISLHVHAEKGSWSPYFSFVTIPKEYSAACKQQGMKKSQIREKFQKELADVLTQAVGVDAQITKGIL